MDIPTVGDILPDTPWFGEMQADYLAKITNRFIVEGNIHDAIPGTYTLTLDYLIRKFTALGKIVAVYNRGNFLNIYPRESEDEFRQITGADALGTKTPQDPFAQAAMGVPKTPDKKPLPVDADSAMALLDTFIRKGIKTVVDKDGKSKNVAIGVVIILEPQTLAPATDWAAMNVADRQTIARMKAWGNDPTVSAVGNRIILLTEDKGDIHPSLKASHYEVITIPYPSRSQRLESIQMFEKRAKEKPTWEADFDAAKLATMTGALRLIDIEDILLRGGREGIVTHALAARRKREASRSLYGDILTFYDERVTDEQMVGIDEIKLACEENIFMPIRTGNWDLLTKGLMVAGPPGCGKTRLFLWIAYMTGFEPVELKLGGQIKSKYVGDSERNLVRSLAAIDALDLALVLIDEAEKAFAQSENDTVSQSLLQIFQTWASDSKRRGKTILMFTTNYPERLPPALIRAGRIELKLFMGVPNDENRLPVLEYHFTKNDLRLSKKELQKLNIATRGWTHAEIGDDLAITAKRIYEINRAKGQKQTAFAAAKEALQTTRPSTVGIASMTESALRFVSTTRYLPPEQRARFKEPRAKTDVSPITSIVEELRGWRDSYDRE